MGRRKEEEVGIEKEDQRSGIQRGLNMTENLS